MTKTKKLLICAVCLVFLSVFILGGFGVRTMNVHADTVQPESTETANSEMSPYLFTTISLTLNGRDGKVWATARNDFTFLPSVVSVILLLYYSDSYCEDYNQMSLVKVVSTEDLDMGQSLVAEASTDGEERFWMGRVRFSDGTGWKEEIVFARYSADGTYLGLT